MINSSIKRIINGILIFIIGFIIGYLVFSVHNKYTGISHSETKGISVNEFIASQPQIAIDMTKYMPKINDYVNRYNK